ncbi:MAG: YdcF family protein [Phycisphaeraceae bacterium]|nr:YdcF family protein [Phycisphaeraceae bacterium]
MSRSIALVLGSFLAVNAAARVLWPGFDATIWLLDLRAWPAWLGTTLIATVAAALLSFACRPRMGQFRQRLTMAAILLLCLAALVDSARIAAMYLAGEVRFGTVIALSWFVLAASVVVLVGAIRSRTHRDVKRGRMLAMGVVPACLAAFPLAQMFLFGVTDYRRPADAILVFGSRTYADGQMSSALTDRMKTACELYRDGLAPKLILSGGPGDGAVHETEAMRSYATLHGVPDAAILLDPEGLNTRSTIRNASALAQKHGLTSMLAVSHFYHLPRVKMTADRAGLAVFTVPSPQGQPLNRLPYFLAREVAACWAYYVKP